MGADGSRVEALFHEALARPPAEREAFLAAACDEATAREVRELLHASEDAPWFLDNPLVASLASLDDGDLPIGTRIGDYEIIERLGSGGMGHVYRARHLRLECDHALKVLRGRGDATADARLLAEARKAARLSHPNICHVYQVGEHDGRAYLSMELVQGVTLQQRLHGGPLPFDVARRYALEIADALAHAHESGLVHADLKPANIMITPQAHVKVLDFGVARRVARLGTGESVTWEAEQAGPIAGTLRYMPPELLRNESVDARGDLWSLGVVLYEMIAGRAAFRGETAFELSSSILRDDPEPFDSTVPPGIEPVVRRCLEKDVDAPLPDGGRGARGLGVARAGIDAARADPPAAMAVGRRRASRVARRRGAHGGSRRDPADRAIASRSPCFRSRAFPAPQTSTSPTASRKCSSGISPRCARFA